MLEDKTVVELSDVLQRFLTHSEQCAQAIGKIVEAQNDVIMLITPYLSDVDRDKYKIIALKSDNGRDAFVEGTELITGDFKAIMDILGMSLR